ncbi:MAG: cell division protein ZapA [Rhodothermales bacterium]
MEKSIRVRILDRDYPLRVREEDEAFTRDVAAYVDAKMQAFKQAHPDQSDLITAVITALSLAEELYTTWDREHVALYTLEHELGALERQLEKALSNGADPPA